MNLRVGIIGGIDQSVPFVHRYKIIEPHFLQVVDVQHEPERGYKIIPFPKEQTDLSLVYHKLPEPPPIYIDSDSVPRDMSPTKRLRNKRLRNKKNKHKKKFNKR